jgi:hypothetical protein
MFTKTEEHEPLNCETLYFSPSWLPEGVWAQNLILGSVEKNLLSLVISKYYKEHPSECCQIWLTKEEVDLMIDRLNEMKQRWDNWKNV